MSDVDPRAVRALVLLVGSGVALGAASVLANTGHLPFAVPVSKLLGNEWPWIAAVVLAGWHGTSWASAAMRGIVMVLPALVVYYALLVGFQTCWGTGCPGVIDAGLVWDLQALVAFSIAGVVLSMVTGLLVMGSRRAGPISLVCRLAVPAYLLYSAASTHHYLQMDPGRDPAGQQVSLFVAWAAAATLAVVVAHWMARFLRRPPSQPSTTYGP